MSETYIHLYMPYSDSDQTIEDIKCLLSTRFDILSNDDLFEHDIRIGVRKAK